MKISSTRGFSFAESLAVEQTQNEKKTETRNPLLLLLLLYTIRFLGVIIWKTRTRRHTKNNRSRSKRRTARNSDTVNRCRKKKFVSIKIPKTCGTFTIKMISTGNVNRRENKNTKRFLIKTRVTVKIFKWGLRTTRLWRYQPSREYQVAVKLINELRWSTEKGERRVEVIRIIKKHYFLDIGRPGPLPSKSVFV